VNENEIGKIIVDTAIEIHQNPGVLAREFKIDYEHRFAEHEHESFVRHACENRHPGLYCQSRLPFNHN
jgi:hypothetical protein